MNRFENSVKGERKKNTFESFYRSNLILEKQNSIYVRSLDGLQNFKTNKPD